MKCIISNEVLLKNLSVLNSVIPSNPSLPILENFLFEVEENTLKVTASDLETSIQISMPVDMVEGTGAIAIPAKQLVDTLKTFSSIPITISNEDPENPYLIEIVAGEGLFKLSGYDAEVYPKRPVIEDGEKIVINSQAISTGIQKTIFATTNDMLRPAMTGVFMQFKENNLNFVGTDAHKLVRFRVSNIEADSNDFEFILPKKSANILKNILSNIDIDVNIEYNKINASFSFDNTNLVCRLIDQKYPAYEAVIPLQNKNKLITNRAELLLTLKRAMIFANQSTHLVKFYISGQSFTLKSEDIDYSNEAVQTLPCTYDGEDMEISFSCKFLIDMINHIDSENVVFEFSDSKRAALILPAEKDNPNEDLLMLIMPITV